MSDMIAETHNAVSVGLLFNTQKRRAVEMAQRLLEWGKSNGVRFIPLQGEASALGIETVSDEEWLSTVKFATVLGGDGTFLRAARHVLGHNIPLYGINLGRLGFLAIGNPDSAEDDIKAIIEGKYTLQCRNTVKGIIHRDGKVIREMYALNDLVITRSNISRVLELEVKVGSDVLMDFNSDGLIISTPTGSTAYSLSAGGPIVPPHLQCMILAPICAHTLYTRPVILGANDKTFITPKGGLSDDVLLTQDGQLCFELIPGDCVEAMIEHKLKIVTIELENRSYYDLLHTKLRWGFNGITEEGENQD